MVPAVISLAHFCDKHGPRVLLVTQAGIPGTTGDELLLPSYPTDSYCDSCSLKFPGGDNNCVRSFKTNVGNKSFVTTQYSSIRYQLLTLIVRRCFSEETMIYDGRPLVFYDDLRGLNLAIGFKLDDESARGNERRYCWILTIDSKHHDASMKLLSEYWNFITDGFSKIIKYIEQCHERESERQNRIKNENNIKLMEGTYLRGNKAKMPKNLSELTHDELLFVRIHKWNSFLLNSIQNSESREEKTWH